MSTENPDSLDEANTKTEIEELLDDLKSASPEKYQCGRELFKIFEEKRPLTVEDLKRLLPLLKSKQDRKNCKSVKVKVLPVTGSKTNGAHEKILKLIHAKKDPKDYEWVLVFCPVLSRVWTDVDMALTKIPEEAKEKDVVLVLMHYTTDISLSTTTQKHPDVKFSVDVLFHDTGYFQCDKNKQAIEQIKTFFKSKPNTKEAIKQLKKIKEETKT
ncbi:hypothetical protein NQD34_009959 [Periophthalmus magnuspinnatus]|nr:hypothetical protein NQD34_009959 [Periophthalmus magnuspinnatus]